MGEIAGVRAGSRALLPQLAAQLAGRLAVVVNELLYVLVLRRAFPATVLQHRVMQDDDARMRERALVDLAVQGIVADVVESDIALVRGDLHGSEAPEER